MAKKFCSMGHQLITTETILTDIIQDRISKLTEMDWICVSLESPQVLDWPVVQPFKRIKNFSTNEMIEDVQKMLQSKEMFGIKGPVLLTIKWIKTSMEGKFIGQKFTFRSKNQKHMTDFLRVKKGLLDPNYFLTENSYMKNSCFMICIAFALLFKNLTNIKRRRFYKEKTIPDSVKKLVNECYENIGLPKNTPIGSEHFDLIQDFLDTNFKIQLCIYEIYNPTPRSCKLCYEGKITKEKQYKKINIIYYGAHYWLITNLTLFTGKKNILCSHCGNIINSRKNHKCFKKCLLCKSNLCWKIKKVISIYCEDCNNFYR
jgi:hypothetical protein